MTISHRKRKFNFGENGGTKYHCDNCKRDITRTVRARCGECSEFDLCIECFSQGKEIKSHKRTHSYRLMDRYGFPLLDIDWSADEEWLLLEAIDMYGMGNWADISAHLGTKELEECRQHYITYYVNSSCYPKPDLNKFFDEIEVDNIRRNRLVSPTKRKYNFIPPMKPKVTPSQPANHEIQGYMPLRKEFDIEHENDAELAVKDMEFEPDDSAVDVELKLAILDIYNQKIDKRLDHKKFALDRNFIDFKKTQLSDRKKPREEKEIWQKARNLSPLMAPEDFNSFVKGLALEKRLREKISSLQEYRRNGISKLSHADRYESAKKQRMNTLYSKSPFFGSSDRLAAKQQNEIQSSSTSCSENPTKHTQKLATQKKAPSPAKPKQSYSPQPLDISNCEGVEHLTTSEQALCSTLRILPRAYMFIKQTLIREFEKRGTLKRRDARSLIRIDVNKLGKVYDFFVSKGWLKP